MDEYIGIVKLFAGTYAPQNWAFCNGALLAISTNQALFSILGTTYGGDGRTTFALPDFRDRVPVGAGNGPNVQPILIGQIGGASTVQLNTLQIPAHTHTGNVQVINAPSTATDPNGNMIGTAVASIGGEPANANIYSPGPGGAVQMAQNSATLNMPMSPQGQAAASQPHNNMQPFLGLNYIICIHGLFPPRN